MTIIYKIFRSDEYAAFKADGQTTGAPIDMQDGYIHISTAEQVQETVAKHFAGEEGLMILGIEAESLGDALKWEVSRGGALFPHLYRELQVDDVLFAHELPYDGETHQFEGLIV